MPRRKKAVDPHSPVPDYVQEAPLMKKRTVTKRGLPTFTEAMLLLHAPEALRLFWSSLLKGLANGDKDAMRMGGEIFEYLKKGAGITITQQMLNQTAVAGASSPVQGFDAFARQLAEARAGHALPLPPGDTIEVKPAQIAEA